MSQLEKYSFGIGDRFGHQAAAQLRAFQRLEKDGAVVIPVWNKSNREHTFIGSEPPSVKAAAEKAVAESGWKHSWHVDADHIRLQTVDRFLPCSDFFTIDVANFIGQPAEDAEIAHFITRHPELIGEVTVPNCDHPIKITREDLQRIARQYLLAMQEAAKVYRHIIAHRPNDATIIEVSIDETPAPQTPADVLVILAALSDQEVPVQTIAPKFNGRFNKGVDYVGNLQQFELEYQSFLGVIAYAIEQYSLPANLKLSVHSGSDKFSLYPVISQLLLKNNCGVHVKTAGTTWLEETIGLCEAGGEGLTLVQEIYAEALDHCAELCEPYADVIDIDTKQLPSAQVVNAWTGQQLAATIRHDKSTGFFNPHVRQLLHVGFKLAAKKGDRYYPLLKQFADVVGKQVEDNLYHRHLRPLFERALR